MEIVIYLCAWVRGLLGLWVPLSLAQVALVMLISFAFLVQLRVGPAVDGVRAVDTVCSAPVSCRPQIVATEGSGVGESEARLCM